MEPLGRDLWQAWRSVRAAPLLATVIVLSLGVGIGVNTTVFAFVQSRVLRPLPGVARASSFHLVEPRAETGSYPGASWSEYRDLRDRLRAFDELFAFRIQALTVGRAGDAERASGLLVSGNYFTALGVRPAAGRVITLDDAVEPGAAAVTVLSYDYWRNRLGGAPDAVGRSLTVNGRTLTVIGVAPEAFTGTVIGMRFDLWVPATMAPALMNGSRELDERSVRGYQMAGRLAATGSVAQAEAELGIAMRDLATDYPLTNQNIGAEVLPFWQSPRGPQRMLVRALAILQGIMLVLLLAVSGNIATLLLARASTRHHEIAVHLAVGAAPTRVARLVLIETLLLALMGAVLGAALAIWLTPLVAAIPLTSGFPVRMDAAVDLASLAVAMFLAVVCTLVAGSGAALQLASVDPLQALQSGARATARGWTRSIVMAAQVALAVMVLIAAGLFLRNLLEARGTDPGFTAAGVLLGRYDLSGRNVAASASREFAGRALDAVRGLPGVESAAIAQQVPLDIHGLPLVSFTLEGQATGDRALPRALSNVVTPGYFDVMRIPLIAGADFAPLADTVAPRQVIVNKAFVATHLGSAAAVGRRIDVGDRTYVVTGVVRNSVSEAFGEPETPCVYFSYRDRPAPVGQFHVRARGEGEATLASGLRRVIGEIDAAMPVYDLRTLSEHLETSLALRKIPARLFLVLGPLILALAAMGIHAVVAHAVSTRRSEIGVRLALGATVTGVVWQIVKGHMTVVGAGCAAGWVFACMAFLRIVQEPVDAGVFLTVPCILLAIAALATWLPARRAGRVDPVMALRS